VRCPGRRAVLFVEGAGGEVLEGVEQAGQFVIAGDGGPGRGAEATQLGDEFGEGQGGLAEAEGGRGDEGREARGARRGGGFARGQFGDEVAEGGDVLAQLVVQLVEGPGGVVGGVAHWGSPVGVGA
jgi:hypothetical protein